RLQGVKAAVPQAEQAGLFVISARTAGADHERDGISLFVLLADTPGLTVRGCAAIDGGRVGELTLEGVQLPTHALLGTEGGGFKVLQAVLELGLLALAAESLGAMEVAKGATLDYLAVRKQFGVAIGSFQALQHRMANLLLEIEQARSAVINAASALDGNDDARARARALAAAKHTVGQVGQLVAEEVIQMHGGIGMTWELPLAHYAKRLVMIDHQLGDQDYHLQRYIDLGRESA
ncbi:MAG: acyl-CoA dehydrogenase, partial [Burkholderiaceae bacterium]